MINLYDIGDVVHCVGTFADRDGQAVDPTTVTFKVRDPTGAITTYVYGTDAQLVKAGVGNYYADVEATASGEWFYRFYSTGNGQAAGETRFGVSESAF